MAKTVVTSLSEISAKLDELQLDMNTLFGRTEGIRMLLQLLMMQYFTSLSLLYRQEVAEVAIQEFEENIEKNKEIFREAFESKETFEGLEAALASFHSAVRDFRTSIEEK